MLAALPRPEAVIVGEPSEMRVVTGHKGSWGFRAHVRGHEVHSSLIHTGVSAVMAGGRHGRLDGAARWPEAARAAAPSDFDPPYTTLHVGMISGGTANNITARDCRFSGEVRCLPGEGIAAWRGPHPRRGGPPQRREARASTPTPASTSRPGCCCPASPRPDGAAEALARALTGDNGRHVVSYQTEAGHFQARGLSTVICGPGSIAQAHQPDEFITMRQLDAGTAFMRRLIARLAA